MNILKVLLGVVLVGIAYETQDLYSPIVMVQGMILVNFGIIGLIKKQSINLM